jgi:hypothetical protein
MNLKMLGRMLSAWSSIVERLQVDVILVQSDSPNCVLAVVLSMLQHSVIQKSRLEKYFNTISTADQLARVSCWSTI